MAWISDLAKSSNKRLRVLDVGCGQGRLLHLLQGANLDVTGIEVNPELVNANRVSGFRVFTPEDFAANTEQYDLVIMSHVIEHFQPEPLLRFMDSYLDRLTPQGKLLVATPLLSTSFFNDFDHVKPYQPAGILTVFSRSRNQVQYQARNSLKLIDLWFRKDYFRVNYFRANYIPSLSTKFLRCVELVGATVLMLSGGKIGQKNGWVGLFEKII